MSYNVVMKNLIDELMKKEKIEYYGIIPFEKCRVINEPLLKRSTDGRTPKSVIMIAVPYYNGEYEGRNISLYAVPKDYHLYFKSLYSRLEGALNDASGYFFKGFADHSPISETYAAAYAGLGVIGKKFQLINDKYGSHVFLGEIITDYVPEKYIENDIKFCKNCGMCEKACPGSDECLSGITQKKGTLNEHEQMLIAKSGCAWGCDVCRTVCPMNSNIEKTPIEFFKTDLIPVLTSEQIQRMSKDEFTSRAYAWKGRTTIVRNLKLIQK